MYREINIRPSLRSTSLALIGAVLAFGHSGVRAPILAAAITHDSYAAIPSARIVAPTAGKISDRRGTLPGQIAQRPSRRLDGNPIHHATNTLASRNRTTTPKRNPSLELYQKRKISPPISPRRRPDIKLINPQERIQPPNYRDRNKRNRKQRNRNTR